MAQHVDGHGLGRWAVLDPANRAFDAGRRLTTLKTVRWDSPNQPILDQGEVGACTGFAVANLLNMPAFARNRHRVKSGYMNNGDGLSFYHLATVRDGFRGTYPPIDTGSTGTAAAGGAKSLGYWTYYGHTFSMSSFLANLQTQPVMMGTLWTRGMMDPDRNGVIHVTGDIDGGHEWAACRYNASTHMVGGLNQWTREWGLSGRFWIPADEVAWLLAKAQSGDVVVPRPI